MHKTIEEHSRTAFEKQLERKRANKALLKAYEQKDYSGVNQIANWISEIDREILEARTWLRYLQA